MGGDHQLGRGQARLDLLDTGDGRAAGADSRLLDASRETARGVVIAALGRGNVPPAMCEGIERWLATGKPVVIRVPTRAGSPSNRTESGS